LHGRQIEIKQADQTALWHDITDIHAADALGGILVRLTRSSALYHDLTDRLPTLLKQD
jgi:hypothetical protein